MTAGFLTKDLGIDWRLSEAHFAERLNDFALAARGSGKGHGRRRLIEMRVKPRPSGRGRIARTPQASF
jgi:hypothetical protein